MDRTPPGLRRQKYVAGQVTAQEGGYVLALTQNQTQLYDQMTAKITFARSPDFRHCPYEFHLSVEKGHGLIETRRCGAVADPAYLQCVNYNQTWIRLQRLVMAKSNRSLPENTIREVQYFISCLPPEAPSLLAATHLHWAGALWAENSVHWVLDVDFREDDSRFRRSNGPQNMARPEGTRRRLAFNLLRQETSIKSSIVGKRKRAGWNLDYRQKALAQ